MSSRHDGQTQKYMVDARCPRGTGLLFFDLDDTIVQAGAFVSPRVLHALRAAQQKGYTLAIASGRSLCMVTKSLLRSGVMEFAVCSNGATVTRLSDGATICERSMSREIVLGCMHAIEPFSPAWNGFFDQKAYFEWKGASYMLMGRTGAMARATGHAKGRFRMLPRLAVRGLGFLRRVLTNKSHRQVCSLRPHVQKARGPIEKIGCSIVNPAECEAAARVLEESGLFEVARMGQTELEVTARGVSKGAGARWLIDELRLDARSCVAFGDGANDLPLCAVVGRFVAMGNADEEVKRSADEVCPSVGEDGVAVWIEKNLL